MQILNIIGEMYFNQKTPIKCFFKFGYVFIKAVIGLNFKIRNILCLTILERYQLNIKHCLY